MTPYVTRALTLGAVGYLLKDAAFAELEFSLKAVRRGDVYLSPRVVEPVINRATSTEADGRTLTRRQTEILRLVASGRSTKEIAFELGLSTKTVDTHRAQLMSRLAIRDVPGLVRYAMRVGLIAPEA